MPRRGGYYLVWKKGKKSIQSNLYHSNSQDPLYPKEVLSLSLKVYYQGGLPQPRHVLSTIYHRPILFYSQPKGSRSREAS
jgi:hypothetical protein